MKKQIAFLIIALAYCVGSFAQTTQNGVNWQRYFFSGTMAVGKGSASTVNPASYAGPSAYLEVGPASGGTKALSIPVVSSSAVIANPEPRMIVYSLTQGYIAYSDTGWVLLGSGAATDAVVYTAGFGMVESSNVFRADTGAGKLATKYDVGLKQNVLVSGTSIKTVNGTSLLGAGNLVISGGGGSNDTTGFGLLTRASAASLYQPSGSYAPLSHTHAQSDVTGLVSALSGKQNTLVSGTSIKTVNGTSLLGSGDITISGGGGASITTSSATTLTLATTYETYVFTGSSNTVWTLPAVSGNTAARFIIKNRGTADITLQRAGSDQIYSDAAATSIQVYSGDAIIIQNDGTYWITY